MKLSKELFKIAEQLESEMPSLQTLKSKLPKYKRLNKLL